MTIQVKRRMTGTSGAPSALKSGQPSWSGVDKIFYMGDGDDGAGNATSIRPIGGDGYFATKTYVTALTLDTFAAAAGVVSHGGFRITNVADPSSAQDVATKAYVDAARSGLDPKDAVVAATTANITLSGTQTIDGVACIAGDRVLVKNQTAGADNGIYVVASGAWSRSTDADTSGEVKSGMFTFVNGGTANALSGWTLSVTGTVTLGTTALVFFKISAAGAITAGNGLNLTGSTLTVVPVSTARLTVTSGGVDLATTAVSPGTYRSVTVDAYGRITAGSAPTTIAGYGLIDAQPLNTILTGIAGQTTNARLTFGSGGIDLASSGITPGTYRSVTIDTYGRATGGTSPTTISGYGITDAQGLNVNLTGIAGLSSAADRVPYFTGTAGASALATFTTFGRSLVDDADATAGRTTLGLGTIATQAASAVSITGGTIASVTLAASCILDDGTY